MTFQIVLCQCASVLPHTMPSRLLCTFCCVCVVTGLGLSEWEDLARLWWAACREEDDFYRVPLQQPPQALWSVALRPGLWPHEQVRDCMQHANTTSVFNIVQKEIFEFVYLELYIYLKSIHFNRSYSLFLLDLSCLKHIFYKYNRLNTSFTYLTKSLNFKYIYICSVLNTPSFISIYAKSGKCIFASQTNPAKKKSAWLLSL